MTGLVLRYSLGEIVLSIVSTLVLAFVSERNGGRVAGSRISNVFQTMTKFIR